jgi:3-hydroxyisobutyrate dehydrogenase
VANALHVGFVGLGNMGWPMARNLARAGFRLTVRDADDARQQRFADEHAARAADAPAAFREVDAVVTMLPTGGVVREVMLEWRGGLASALARGAIVVDMSSSDPTGTRELGRALAADGVALVDAPVSGGVPKADAGTLAIMIGGDDKAAIERARPLLDAMGKKLFLTGPLGSGHAMKALNNYVAAAGFTAAAEALIVGWKFGLDPAVMVEILNASTGRNFSTEYTMKEHVLPRAFATGFSLGLLAKDVAIAADLVDAIGADAPVCRLLRELWAEASTAMGGGVDHSAALRHWEQQNGVELPARPPRVSA